MRTASRQSTLYATQTDRTTPIKGNGHLDHVDYIVIPTDQIPTITHSEVIDCIDMHQKDEDH